MEGTQILSAELYFLQSQNQRLTRKQMEKQWKNARIQFFNKQLHEKLNEANVQGNPRRQILQLFSHQEDEINIDNLGDIRPYKNLIKSLKQRLLEIQEYFRRKERQCLPLLFIIQNQITNLKTIHIEYETNSYRAQNCYSISSFVLFKVIHNNRILNEVTLRGIFVEEFQQFIKLINPLNNLQSLLRQQLSWIKKFNPLKSLRLSINAKIQFKVQNKQETFILQNDLAFFIGMFISFSDIDVVIRLGFWNKIKQWGINLQNLWKYLRKIKRIKIKIETYKHQNKLFREEASIIRSILFGRLTALTQIASLSFNMIKFNQSVCQNDFLVMEENLRNIFDNNSITSFTIIDCEHFPNCTGAINLQEIRFQNSFFRNKKSNFSIQMTQNNKSLRSIIYTCHQQYHLKWQIGKELADKLQSLAINDHFLMGYDSLILKVNQLTFISRLKHMRICNKSLIHENCLNGIFPRLISLHSLMYHFKLEHQIICTIPSVFLQELHLIYNQGITDQGLQKIDTKWPQLRCLELRHCQYLTQNIWQKCTFKGLLELRVNINSKIIRKEKKILQSIKSKGIKLYQT